MSFVAFVRPRLTYHTYNVIYNIIYLVYITQCGRGAAGGHQLAAAEPPLYVRR